MVHTRHHPEGSLEKLSESGKLQAERQPEGPIAKKPKTHPLLEADREIEEGIEKQYAKEKKRLAEAGDAEQPEAGEEAEGEEYEPTAEEEAEAAREKETEGEELRKGTVPAKEAMAEKGEAAGEEAVEGENETVEVQAGQRGGAKKGGKGATKTQRKGALGLQVGKPAPEFTLQDQDGNNVSLKQFKGKPVAIYFYNKDDTPVVNKGGMAFAKIFPEMQKMGVPLLFIGPDSVQSHKKFQQKAKLPFLLLSDNKKEVAKAFHNLRGRNVLRTTVLIDPEGKVLQVYPDIPEDKVDVNPKEALHFMKSMMAK